MELVNYSKKAFDKLHPFNIYKQTISTEADFFMMPGNNPHIIKKYKDNSKSNLTNKINTVFDLEENKEKIKVPSLVIPDKAVAIGGKFVGFASPYIEGLNVEVILSGKNVPLNLKVKILKQIGHILHQVDTHYHTINLSFGDVHPGNFIFNGEKTYAVDTDSMKIKNNKVSPSLYLERNPNVCRINKYDCNSYGMYFVNPNTDILSFIMIILGVIADGDVYKLNLYQYYEYLDYLDHLGIDKNLLNAFMMIYDNTKDNINPTPFLDSLNNLNEKATLKEFRKVINH